MMTECSDCADRGAVAAVQAHHGMIAETLRELTNAVLTAAASGAWEAERQRLLDWYTNELLPYAEAEETALYGEAADLPETGLLVSGLTAEHRMLAALADELEAAQRPVEVVAAAAAAQSVLTVHLGKEDDLLLPALEAAGVDLISVLAGMPVVRHDRAGPTTQRPPAAADLAPSSQMAWQLLAIGRGVASEDEQQIGQAVEVAEHLRADGAASRMLPQELQRQPLSTGPPVRVQRVEGPEVRDQ